MEIRHLVWLSSLALLAGCPDRLGSTEDGETLADEVGNTSGSSSDGESSSDTNGTSSDSSSDDASSSSNEADVETGPFPDLPDELPVGCDPVYFMEPAPSGTLTDMWSGWVVCGKTGNWWEVDGFRLEAIDCPFAMPLGPCDECGGCSADEECLQGDGYCFCGNNCTSDSDCAPSESCLCRSGFVNDASFNYRNQCLPSSCRGEADCEPLPGDTVPLCRLGRDLCFSPETIQCRTAVDACTFDTDCASHWCRWDQGDEFWSCDDPAICE